MAVLMGVAVSYERGTPVTFLRCMNDVLFHEYFRKKFLSMRVRRAQVYSGKACPTGVPRS